jgi:outer membrane protein, heavy metal efflux system
MNLIKVLLKASILALKAIFSKNRSCCGVLIIMMIMAFASPELHAQRTISLQELLDSAMNSSPMLKGAQASVMQQKHLLKTTFNLPNPEILIQNPTGHFYTVGVQQNFDFPTVYGAQRSLQKANVKLAESSYQLTAADLKYQIAVLYIELQFQDMQVKLWQSQDTVYRAMSATAEALFKAGEIDFLQLGFTRVMAGEIHNNFIIAQASSEGLKQRLKILSGVNESFKSDSLKLFDKLQLAHLFTDSAMQANPVMKYQEQLVQVSQKQLQLAKQRVIPGFTFAYLNQAEKNTPLQNRFYAGIRIPLWFWQYNGSISAARSELDARRYDAYANNLEYQAKMTEATTKYRAYVNNLENYNGQMLKDIQGIIEASPRLLKAGDRSYMEHLKILSDALNIQKNYWETLRSFKQTEYYMRYLTGSL